MINKSAVKVFWTIFFIVLAGIIAIYGVLFDSLSESAMIELSYLWSGPLLYAIVGLIAAYNGAKKSSPYLIALAGLFAAPFLLFMFFQVFWRML